MIKLGPRHFLAENPNDLPNPRPGAIFLDCETRRRGDDITQAGNSPWLGDRAAMWGIAFDDDGPAVAVPFRMREYSGNLEPDRVLSWLHDVLSTATLWVNHNVKFDAHFAAIDGVVFPSTCQLVDTLTLAKLIDSDRYSHGLKELLRDWLDKDTSSQERIGAWLKGYKLPHNRRARDYALVPADLMGFYNCDDVLGNRELYRHCLKQLPAQVLPTWEMEQKLTPVLWDMEVAGLRTDERELNVARVKSLHKQITMATRVNELTDTEFADSAPYSYALLVAKWGLPVLSRNKESGNPSFDYESLLLYLNHPEVVADPMKSEVIKLMMGLRDEETFCSLFVNVFLEERDVNGYVHPIYNQLVRTGRMSCSGPNAQQFNTPAKQLVLVDGEGMSFYDADASQIEFRFIVHYIKDEDAIKLYNEKPDTDFHQWVADLCEIARRPAKNINFATAFGAGKKKIVGMLAADETIVATVTATVDKMIADGQLQPAKRMEAFARLCWDHGEMVFNKYHDKLPTLKATSQRAQGICAARGFVFNMYGRRRQLNARGSHKAFNTVVQGSAMDLIKRRMIATAPRYNPEMVADGITLRANIHDSVLYHGPKEAILKWIPWINAQLEAPEPLLRVPVKWEGEVYEERWKAAQ